MKVGPLEFSATTGTAHELHNRMFGILQLEKKLVKNIYHSIATLMSIRLYEGIQRKNPLIKLHPYMY